MRTKWEILHLRIADMETGLAVAREELKTLEQTPFTANSIADMETDLADAREELKTLEQTPFTANSTGECSGCGEELATEADFAKHFLVPDERYINLGNCPNSVEPERPLNVEGWAPMPRTLLTDAELTVSPRPINAIHKPSEICNCPNPMPGKPFHCAVTQNPYRL